MNFGWKEIMAVLIVFGLFGVLYNGSKEATNNNMEQMDTASETFWGEINGNIGGN